MNNNTFSVLCKPGLSSFCLEELKRFSVQIISKDQDQITFDIKNQDQLLFLFQHLSVAYSFSKVLWQGMNLSNIAISDEDLKNTLDLVLNSNKSDKQVQFRVLCEGISGNENRISFSKQAGIVIHQLFKKQDVELKINYKLPQIIFSLSQCEKTKKFTLGLKLHENDLSKRDWRIFTHKASFKGDFAASICEFAEIYHNINSHIQDGQNNNINEENDVEENDNEKLIRKNEKMKKIAFIFSRDGAIAIEAVCRLTSSAIRSPSKFIKKMTKNSVLNQPIFTEEFSKKSIYLVDDSAPNIRASSNNAKMLGVNDYMKFLSISISDIQEHLPNETFNYVIVQMTTKDERRINEILKQSFLILKSNGKLVFITREGFDVEEDSRFSLLKREIIQRGSGYVSVFMFEKI